MDRRRDERLRLLTPARAEEGGQIESERRLSE
jgi:hypothetical protein